MVNVDQTPEGSTNNFNVPQQQLEKENENSVVSEHNGCWEDRHVPYVDLVHRYNYLEYIASTTSQDLQAQLYISQHNSRQAGVIINQLMVENSVLRVKANQMEQEIVNLRATAIDILKNTFKESYTGGQVVNTQHYENNPNDNNNNGNELPPQNETNPVSTTADLPSSSSDSKNITPNITERSSDTNTTTTTTTTIASSMTDSSSETAQLHPPNWPVLLQNLLQPPQLLNMSSRFTNFPVSEESMSLAALSYLHEIKLIKMSEDSQILTNGNKTYLNNVKAKQIEKENENSGDYYSVMKNMNEMSLNKDDKKEQEIEFLSTLFPKYRLGHKLHDNYSPFSSDSLSGSLGTVKARSSLAPGTRMDVHLLPKDRKNEETLKTNNDPQHHYRAVLITIEKLYRCLLEIDECDIRLKILKYGSQLDKELREMAVQKVVQTLQDVTVIQNILTVDKGKMVISRLLPLFDKSFAVKILIILLKSISASWSKNSELEKMYSHLRSIVLQVDKEDVIMIVKNITDSSLLEKLVTNKLGISLLMTLLYQGDNLYYEKTDEEKLSSFKETWINGSGEILKAMKEKFDKLEVPFDLFQYLCYRSIVSSDHYWAEDIKGIMKAVVEFFLLDSKTPAVLIKHQI